ncbi:MAG: hypothetical protein H0T86_14110 [Gemmatimonadales bacterium]|nr:hypothetical protein [Gemmatimonadales bacterium]
MHAGRALTALTPAPSAGRCPTARTGQRLSAALLLILFLGAGTSLPSLDALLYHARDGGQTARTHVEPAGPCASHAQHCTLGQTAPGSGAALVAAAALRLESAPPLPAPLAPVVPAAAAEISREARPRAPPAALS